MNPYYDFSPPIVDMFLYCVPWDSLYIPVKLPYDEKELAIVTLIFPFMTFI